MSIMKAAFAAVCQEPEKPRTAPSMMNPSPPPLMLVKEALNNYEMGSPTLTARGKEALSCVIIRTGDVCIAPPLSSRTRSPKREQGTKHPFSKDD